MTKPTTIILTSTYIELHKVLKLEGLAASGAEAKNLVAAGLVEVNGEVELRKRRKLIAGDKVEYSGQQLLMQ